MSGVQADKVPRHGAIKRLLSVLLSVGLLAATGSAAGALRLARGAGRNVMIELFTSEGCNSCPPAEAPDHAARQRRYARRGRVRTVYTPAFLVNGRPWGVSGSRATLPEGGAPAGTLAVRVRDGKFETHFAPAGAAEIHGARRLALAAWVNRPGDPTPLQATGGYLPQ